MAGAIYGSGFIELEPKMDGFEGQVKRGLDTVGKTVLGVVAGVAAIGTGIAAIAVKGGISRALNIEDAQAKLRGLGHDAEALDTIMASALDSVRGTAFGLDAAAGAAASAVAAGIEPGEDLTRVLGLTADAATIMGRSFNDAGAIINKILASNRVSMEEVNQLHDAGLPILSLLAEQYDVNAQAMREMVSQGVVDSERFLDALESNIGGAALQSGETTRGAFANMQAAMSRFGERLLRDVFPLAKEVFGGITVAVDDMAERIGPALERFADSDAFAALQDHVERIPEYFETGVDAVMSFWNATEFVRDGVGLFVSGTVGLFQTWEVKLIASIAAVRLAWGALTTALLRNPLGLALTGIVLAAGAIREHVESIQGPIENLKTQFEELPKAVRTEAVRDALEEAWGSEAIDRLEVFLGRSGKTIEDFADTTDGVAHLIEISGQDIEGTWQSLVDQIETQTGRTGKIMRDGLESSDRAMLNSSAAATGFAAALGEAADATSASGGEMADALDTLQQEAGEAFLDISGDIDTFITGFEELPEIVDITMDQFITNLTDRTQAVSDFYDNLLILSGSGFDALVADLSEKGPEAAAGLAEDFANNINTAATADAAIRASQALGEAAASNLVTQQQINDAIAAGRAISEGVASGVNHSAWLVVNAASEMVNKALQGARNTIQAFSPSRLFARLVGEPISQGVAFGIDSAAGEAQGALDRMLGGLTDADIPALTAGVRVAASASPTGVTGTSGVVIEQLTVNNPIGEPTEESLASPALEVAVSSYLR